MLNPYCHLKTIIIHGIYSILLALPIMVSGQQPMIIDHHCTDLYKIPENWIDSARQKLHIAYGHTSHGYQLISGMTGLSDKFGNQFAFSEDEKDDVLFMDDYFADGDLGNPDFITWESRTRNYLNLAENQAINTVMWAWCGQLNEASEENVNTYLSLMSGLENDYPHVNFVYMTGHLDGSGAQGNLNIRNEQIRKFCKTNNKILFDFADIESYDPDGLINYMELLGNDNCSYDKDGDTHRESNWAEAWSAAHPDSCFYHGYCDHSQALNCQRKGIAAWWLWAGLAGWNTGEQVISVDSISIFPENGITEITGLGQELQLNAHIYPQNATFREVEWSVTNISGQASIRQSGLLTSEGYGMIEVNAIAKDNPGIHDVLGITIREVTTGVENGSIKNFNPEIIREKGRGTLIGLSPNDKIEIVRAYSLTGTLVWSGYVKDNFVYIPEQQMIPSVSILVFTGSSSNHTLKLFNP